MPKITLPTIEAGYLSTDALNQAMADVATAFDNTLSLDGSAPNQMEADLDLNGHRLLNVTTDLNDAASLLTVGQMEAYVDARASGLVLQRVEQQTATAGQTVVTLTTMTYTPNSNNLAVFVNGLRKFRTTDYTENNNKTITFLAGLNNNDKVVCVSNNYVATIDLPQHSHVWADISDPPVYTTRWPSYSELTGVPTSFTPVAHVHAASDITSGRLTDAQRGVYVQSSQPTGLGTGDAGAIWLW